MNSFAYKTAQFCDSRRECEMAEHLASATVRNQVKTRAKLSFELFVLADQEFRKERPRPDRSGD